MRRFLTTTLLLAAAAAVPGQRTADGWRIAAIHWSSRGR